MNPYRQGVEAHRNGQWHDANPYQAGTTEFKQWENGMNAACADFYLD